MNRYTLSAKKRGDEAMLVRFTTSERQMRRLLAVLNALRSKDSDMEILIQDGWQADGGGLLAVDELE